MTRALGDEQIAKARKLRDEGMTYQAIGDAVGVSITTAYHWLNPASRKRARTRALKWYKKQSKKEAYRERHRIAFAEYYKTHSNDEAFKEKARARTREWYAGNKQKAKVANAEYRQNHLSEHNASNAIRRALVLGATTGNLVEIAEVYRRAKEDPKVCCYLCGQLIPMGHRHVDHIVPISKGGTHRPSNLAVACDECNLRKSDKLPEKVGMLI